MLRIYIKIMKRFTLLIIILMYVSCFVKAQDMQVEYANMIRGIKEQHILEITAANHEIDSLKTLSHKLATQLADSTKKIISLNKEILRLMTQLRLQKEANEKQELKKAEIIKPYQDNIASLEGKIASKDSLISAYSLQIAALQESEGILKSDYSILKNQLQDLHSFMQIYVRNKIKEESPYAYLPYSQIDLNHISEVLALCERLNTRKLDTLSNLFNAVMQRKIKYDLYISSINRSYNQEIITELLRDKQQLFNASNGVQQEELSLVISSMESYNEANIAFIEIVNQISNYMKDFRQEGYDVASAKEGAEYYLASGRVTYFFNKFSQIPYLVNLFERYKKDLLDNPTSAPQIESDILNK